jgi:hypothetical protein
VPERHDPDDVQQPGGPDEAALAIVARHALHDEELIASLAAGALDGEDEADERSRARSLVERCPVCSALHDDVAAIGAALNGAAAFTAHAPRDFRLTVEDAQRLGGTVVTRRVTRGFRALFGNVARPLGASVAALGLVGVLVGSAVLGAAGLGGAPAADSATSGGVEPSGAAAAAPSTFEVASGPTDGPKASERNAVDASLPPTGPEAVAPDAAAWLLGISIAAMILGVLLFVVAVRVTRSGAGRNEPR